MTDLTSKEQVAGGARGWSQHYKQSLLDENARLRGQLEAAEQHVKILQAQVQGFSPETAAEPDIAVDEWTVMNLVGHIRRLTRQLDKFDTDNKAASQAREYLVRHGVVGNLLRGPESAPKTPCFDPRTGIAKEPQ